MKHAMLVLLLAAGVIAGCSSSQETRTVTEPRTYDETMYTIADDVRVLDKHLIGAQYEGAERQMHRIVRYANHLANYEPLRSTTRYEDYTEYRAQVDDLARASERLRFLVEQRRLRSAEDMLAEVARRYNRLSANYGPGYQIGVLERSPNEFKFSESERTGVPGELQNRR